MLNCRCKSSGHLGELSKPVPLDLTNSFHTAETSAGGGETSAGGGETCRRCGVLVASQHLAR